MSITPPPTSTVENAPTLDGDGYVDRTVASSLNLTNCDENVRSSASELTPPTKFTSTKGRNVTVVPDVDCAIVV